MKSIKQYIIESNANNICPKDKKELQEIILKLCKQRGNEGDFNDIDVSNITDMSRLFFKMKDFNGDISQWNVSNVTNMEAMFYGCTNFECNLRNWDVSNVKDIGKMFYGCRKFEGKNLDVWDLRQLKNKYYDAFEHCKSKPKWYK